MGDSKPLSVHCYGESGATSDHVSRISSENSYSYRRVCIIMNYISVKLQEERRKKKKKKKVCDDSVSRN